MPLQSLFLALQVSWQMQRANIGFKNTTEGPDSEVYSWAANSALTATFTQLFACQYTVFAASTAPTSPAATLAAGGSLTVSTEYFYKITAVAENTDGSLAETQGSTEVNVTPTSGNQTASLTWTALTGATSYNIYRGTTTGGENLLVGNTTGTTFSDTGFTGASQSPPSSTQDYVEFGLLSFTSLAGESVTATAVLSLLVVPTGTDATCVLAPGGTDGLTWFFEGTSPGHNVPINGAFFHSEDPNGGGQALTSDNHTLRLTNGGTAALTVSVEAPVAA